MKNIDKIYVDKRTSKNGKEYYALFGMVNKVEFLICFVNKSVYEQLD